MGCSVNHRSTENDVIAYENGRGMHLGTVVGPFGLTKVSVAAAGSELHGPWRLLCSQGVHFLGGRLAPCCPQCEGHSVGSLPVHARFCVRDMVGETPEDGIFNGEMNRDIRV